MPSTHCHTCRKIDPFGAMKWKTDAVHLRASFNSRRRVFRMVWPIVLLIISNVFMTFAWYGHLKDGTQSSLPIVILSSWGIAFFEYVFQVPANRMGHAYYSAAQLKTIQEVITLTVFAIFSVVYLKEQLRWNYFVGFGLIIVAVFFIMHEW